MREPYRRGFLAANLPSGMTCGDCTHYERCYWLLGRLKNDEVCDWKPSRFASANLVRCSPHAAACVRDTGTAPPAREMQRPDDEGAT